MNENDLQTDRDQDFSRVSHISQNTHGMTKLLVSLPIATRLRMLVASEACAVSQQWLAQQGTLHWSDLVRFATEHHISPISIQDEFRQYLAQREEFLGYLAAKARAAEIADAEADVPGPKPKRAPRKPEGGAPAATSPANRRGVKKTK